jgi:hypothetical protein
LNEANELTGTAANLTQQEAETLFNLIAEFLWNLQDDDISDEEYHSLRHFNDIVQIICGTIMIQ